MVMRTITFRPPIQIPNATSKGLVLAFQIAERAMPVGADITETSFPERDGADWYNRSWAISDVKAG